MSGDPSRVAAFFMECALSDIPDLSQYVGQPADEVVEHLQNDFDKRGWLIHKIEEGSVTTMDFRTDRVRVWYDPATGLATDVSVG